MLKPLHDWIMPKVLGAGIVTSLLVLSLIGKTMTSWVPFDDFIRFNHFICFETQYYPTALQVRETARRALDPDKIAVVIGGGSVFNGWAQRPGHIWSQKLQSKLGDRFRVVNLAMTNTAPNEIGMTTAESLLSEYPKLIFLADHCMSTVVDMVPAGSQHPYFFWDNYYRGLVPFWPPRAQLLEKLNKDWEVFPSHSELLLGQRFNSIFNANELWNTIGYRYVFTIYESRYFGGQFCFIARRLCEDEPLPADPYSVRLERLKYNKAGLREEMMAILNVSSPVQLSQERLNACYPPSMRARSIIVLTPVWKRAWDEISQEDAKKVRIQQEKLKAACTKIGLTVKAYQDEFPEEFFLDSLHLDEDGGEILARLLADEIRGKSKELGYE